MINYNDLKSHFMENFPKNQIHCCRGADLGFSRGWGRFSKRNRKFWRPFFFQVDQIDFLSSPKARFAPILAKFSTPQANFWKKGVFRHFLKNFDKKNYVFSVRAPPLKNSKYWRQRRLYKNFRVGRSKVDFLKSTKGWTLWVGRVLWKNGFDSLN